MFRVIAQGDFQGVDHAHPIADGFEIRIGGVRLRDRACVPASVITRMEPATMVQSLIGVLRQPDRHFPIDAIGRLCSPCRPECGEELDQQLDPLAPRWREIRGSREQ